MTIIPMGDIIPLDEELWVSRATKRDIRLWPAINLLIDYSIQIDWSLTHTQETLDGLSALYIQIHITIKTEEKVKRLIENEGEYMGEVGVGEMEGNINTVLILKW